VKGYVLLALSRFGRKCGKSPIEFTELIRLVLADFFANATVSNKKVNERQWKASRYRVAFH
jgi:hypothetical protein